MYVNTIKYEHNNVVEFITSKECFTPENPVYAAVQKTLVEMGYEQECNHVFKGKGWLGVLRFCYSEVDLYQPDRYQIDNIKSNRSKIIVAAAFISDLEYIFTTDVPADKVDMILK